jgi:hypothetical protein
VTVGDVVRKPVDSVGHLMPHLPSLETAQRHLIRPAKERRMSTDKGFAGGSVVRDTDCGQPQPQVLCGALDRLGAPRWQHH